MTKWIISKSKLKGEITLPSSKSHSIRAIVFATLAKGTSRIEKLLSSPDIDAALKAAGQFGAKVTISDGPVSIEGTAGKVQGGSTIHCGNSGQVLRFFGALAALSDQVTTLTGDHSIQTNRPVDALIQGLKGLKAKAKALGVDGHAPISVQGPAEAGAIQVSGEDSQPISGLLMLAAFLKGKTTIKVKNPGERPWIDLTLNWFDWMKVPYQREGYTLYEVQGKNSLEGFQYTVPGDLSSASFPAAAAFATKSKILLKNFDRSDVQGDKKFFDALEQMGAHFEYNAPKKELYIDGTQKLKGVELDINDYIDAIAILAVVGCFAEGTTRITNAAIAKKKESNRIECICKELKKMNASIEETEDGLIVHQSDLKDATVDSHHDHRIALSLAVAALAADETTVIHNVECTSKSYPNFAAQIAELGAKVDVS